VNHWTLLAINPTRDPQVIRSAYLSQLLDAHPGDQPDSFHMLREAYEDSLDDILKEEVDDDFSLLDLYCDSENDPTPITPTYNAMESAGANDTENLDLDSVKKFEIEAARHIEKLVQRLSFENQQSASFYLNELLKLPELNDLILRSAFERLLQRSLTLIVPFPAQLAIHTHKLFNWAERLKQPHDCYLAAVQYLIEREDAYDRIDKLEDLGAKRLVRRGRMARALLGDYNPVKFWRLALRKSNMDEIKAQLYEVDKISPKLLPFMLDPRTVEWWRNAVMQRRLFLKDYLAALSISLVITFFLGVFDEILNWDALGTTSQVLSTIGSLFFVLVLIMLINNQLRKNQPAKSNTEPKKVNPKSVPHSQPVAKKHNWREPVQEYFEHASEKIDLRNRFYIIAVAFMVTAFSLILVNSGELMNALAIFAYTSMMITFGVSLFFYVNFSAMFLQFMLSKHEWFADHIAFFSKLQVHSFYVLDVVVSFILLNIALQMTCRILRYPLGISNLQVVSRPLYELLLIIVVLVLHVVVLYP